MIPDLIKLSRAPWKVLPEGIHQATLAEVKMRFANNPKRRQLYWGFVTALNALKAAGVKDIYLDGSFVTDKPIPGDFDVCWDPSGVDPTLLDPVFLDFQNKRAKQKAKFNGEFFLYNSDAMLGGPSFLEFFQNEKNSGLRKGIVLIDISAESLGLPLAQQRVTQ